MSDKGTDKRPPMLWIEQAVLTDYDLTANEGWVYLWIVRHINGKTGEAFPSLTTLAKETKLSRPTVVKCIHKLETLRLIEIEHTTKADGSAGVNHYKLLPVEVVNHVDGGSKAALPGVVKPVDSNHLESLTIKDSAPNGASAQPPEERAVSTTQTNPTCTTPHPRNAWYDAVQKIFGFAAGLNADYQKMLRGEATKKSYAEYNIEPGMTLEELHEWQLWYTGYTRTADGRYVQDDHARDLCIIKARDKLQSSVYEFRQWKLARLQAIAAAPKELPPSRWANYNVMEAQS